MHDSVMTLLPQTLTDRGKILQAYVGRTQMSCVKIFKMAAKSGCFVTGTMNAHFFATGQIGINRCPLLNFKSSIKEF